MGKETLTLLFIFFSFDNEDLLQKGTVATSLPDQLDLIYEMGKERDLLMGRERNREILCNSYLYCTIFFLAKNS